MVSSDQIVTRSDNVSIATEHLSVLAELRRRGTMNGGERWAILRVFFALKREDEVESTQSGQTVHGGCPKRVAGLMGRSERYVAGLLAKWNEKLRASTSSTEDIRNFIYDPP